MSISDSINEVKDLVDQEKFEEALTLADKLLGQFLDIQEEIGLLCDQKGYSLTKLGRIQKALKFNDIAVVNCPVDPICHCNRSWTLGLLGRHEESLEECEIAISLDPNYAIPWNNKGMALYSLGKPAEGLKCVEKALELDPTNENAQDSKEQILDALGRTD